MLPPAGMLKYQALAVHDTKNELTQTMVLTLITRSPGCA